MCDFWVPQTKSLAEQEFSPLSIGKSEYLYIANIKLITASKGLLASAGRMNNWEEIL